MTNPCEVYKAVWALADELAEKETQQRERPGCEVSSESARGSYKDEQRQKHILNMLGMTYSQEEKI